MQTECTPDLFGFAPVEGRRVEAAFDGGKLTSDAGALLPRLLRLLLLSAALYLLWPASVGLQAEALEHRRRGRGDGSANPRFVVTSLQPGEIRARRLYEALYCARGEMENRIKECQLDLFADRPSARSMRANQLRLWFASMAYELLCALRRIGLAHTRFARATCGRIRLTLLKIAALVRISVRRIKFAMATGCPYQAEFQTAHARLAAAAV